LNRENVLVIGGAAGIGKQIVLDFAGRGKKVAVADINKKALDQLINESGRPNDIFSFEVDVSNWESVQNMMTKVKETLNSIDIFVYSAGITKQVSFLNIDWASWKKTIAVNLHGLFFSTKAVLPLMKNKNGGSIIIIGSGSAITGSGGGIHYAASKGGAFGFMRSLVGELGKEGININVIAPRVIESDMLDRLYPSEGSKNTLKKEIPIGRLGKPSDISNLTNFLSNEESAYIHGQIIIADGGRTFKPKSG